MDYKLQKRSGETFYPTWYKLTLGLKVYSLVLTFVFLLLALVVEQRGKYFMLAMITSPMPLYFAYVHLLATPRRNRWLRQVCEKGASVDVMEAGVILNILEKRFDDYYLKGACVSWYRLVDRYKPELLGQLLGSIVHNLTSRNDRARLIKDIAEDIFEPTLNFNLSPLRSRKGIAKNLLKRHKSFESELGRAVEQARNKYQEAETLRLRRKAVGA